MRRITLIFPYSSRKESDFAIKTRLSTPPNGKESIEMHNLQQRFEKILLGESDEKNFSHPEVSPILKKIGRVISFEEKSIS